MESKINVAIIVPLLNEADIIEAFVESLVANLPSTSSPYEKAMLWEIIFVDDHSTDKTWEVLARISTSVTRDDFVVRAIKSSFYPGKSSAQACGLSLAGNFPDVIVFMDGDGQHPVSQVSTLVEMCLQSDCVVIGRRTGHKRNLAATIGIRLLGSISSIIGINFDEQESEFVAAPGKVGAFISETQTLGILPLVPTLRSSGHKNIQHDVAIEPALGDNRGSRFSFAALVSKALYTLVSDPARILPRLSILVALLCGGALAYGVSIGIESVRIGKLDGVASILLVQSVFFAVVLALMLFNTFILTILFLIVQRGRTLANTRTNGRQSDK